MVYYFTGVRLGEKMKSIFINLKRLFLSVWTIILIVFCAAMNLYYFIGTSGGNVGAFVQDSFNFNIFLQIFVSVVSVYMLHSTGEWLGLCAFFLLSGCVSGNLYWQYFPSIRGMLAEPLTIGLEAAYFGLCITPAAIDFWEDRQWRYLRSKI